MATTTATVSMPTESRLVVRTEARVLLAYEQSAALFTPYQIFDAGLRFVSNKLKAAKANPAGFMFVIDVPFELPTGWQKYGLRTQFSEEMKERHAAAVAARVAARGAAAPNAQTPQPGLEEAFASAAESATQDEVPDWAK